MARAWTSWTLSRGAVNRVGRTLPSIYMLSIPAFTLLCLLHAPRGQAAGGRQSTVSGSPHVARSGAGSRHVASPASSALLGGELG